MSKVSSERKFQTRIAIFTVIAPFIITGIIDKWRDKPVFSTIEACFKWLWYSILDQQFRVWQILLFLVILILLLILLSATKSNKIQNGPDSQWMNYTKDRIAGIEYKWKWVKHLGKGFFVSDLRPICPKCGTSMQINPEFYAYTDSRCPRCEYILRIPKSSEDIIALIHDNCDRNIYPLS